VTPKHFSEHLEVLRRKYHPLSLKSLRWRKQMNLWRNGSVVLTFDDGYCDALSTAKPLLEKFDVPAAVFVVAGNLGETREFWWDELERILLSSHSLPETLELDIKGRRHKWNLRREDSSVETHGGDWNVLMEADPTPQHSLYRQLMVLFRELDAQARNRALLQLVDWAGSGTSARTDFKTLASEGLRSLAKGGLIEVGSHTMSHPPLSALSIKDQRSEIALSKLELEAVLAQTIMSFSYPFGSRQDYTADTVKLVKESGYSCACVNFPGLVGISTDPYQLRRFLVRDWDGDEFDRRLESFFKNQIQPTKPNPMLSHMPDFPRISVVTPCISVVTPSFQQAQFLEETMSSVLNQNYPDTEYIVIDGGSTDGSVDIIRRYSNRLAYWVSEPDRGQYHAINKGFQRTTGEVMAWINSSDKYTPWAFRVVGEIFSSFPEVRWLTTLYPLCWNERGLAVQCERLEGFNPEAFFRGRNLAGEGRSEFGTCFIEQESTFWRRSLWEQAGAHLDDDLKLAGDFELWARFFEYADLYAVVTPLAGFRFHREQKIATSRNEYYQEAESILGRYSRPRPGSLELWLRRILAAAPSGVSRRIPRAAYQAKIISWSARRNSWDIYSRFFV
jgi:peptidoglycan/xylan/chitin deacetylase (PgdA/CDA1 family)/glycosyltransferase involved in cell wall biosynthesis